MKKKIGILALVLIFLMCFLTVSSFAGEDIGNSQMPFVDSDQITPEQPDIQTEEDIFEEFEEIFGEFSGPMAFVFISMFVSMLLFLPSLITMIVFIILNRNAKKKVREYEKFFGPIPQNASAYYNPDIKNAPYATQPVNPTNIPMGTAPSGNPYIPQNNENNQQGGSSDEKN